MRYSFFESIPCLNHHGYEFIFCLGSKFYVESIIYLLKSNINIINDKMIFDKPRQIIKNCNNL